MKTERRTWSAVLRELLLTAAALLGVLCVLAAVASFAFHVRPLIFRSGSMGPAIETGALGLARQVPATALQVGDVVSVPNSRGVRITHRIHTLDTNGPNRSIATLTLKGDANNVADAEPYVVDHADRLFFHLNHLGYVIAWLGHRPVVFAGGALVGVLGGWAFRPRPDGTPPAGAQPRRRRPPTAAAPLIALVVGSLGVLVGPHATATLAAFANTGAATTGTLSSRYWRCDNVILADGPRIYYKLDETASLLNTTATDSSGQARNGVYQGTVTKGVASPCKAGGGTAVTFNGSTGYVDFATQTTVPVTYSVEAWFNTTTTKGGLLAGWGAAATGASGTTDRVLYMTNAGALVFGNNNAAKAVATATGPYNNGAWHHVIATVGTTGMRIYVDGAQAGTSATTATATYGGYFRIGYDALTGWTNAPTSSFFAGTLDEVAVYSTTLTLTDAQQHYAARTY